MITLLRSMRTRSGERAGSNALRILWVCTVTLGLAGQTMAGPPLEQAEIRYQGWDGQVTLRPAGGS
jgi:hypothetical protein